MPDEEKTKVRLEIAHVLFMDIVGYSKLLIDEQSESLHELNRIVRNTDAVREAEAAHQLVLLPTGDGMALVFTSSVQAPVECALQISQALRAQPSLPLRMGIHSGPVQHISDVNARANIAGAGINIAQRVMDCGDAGHILVSKRVADDLSAYRQWQPYLHNVGDCEVKHGVIVSLVNLYAEVVGNPALPTKLGAIRGAARRPGRRLILGAAALLAVVALIFGLRRWVAPERHIVPAAPAATVPADVPEKSIAVLPFDNFSEDKDSAFFADGVQDEVLTDLAKVADLKVISRSSVLQYKTATSRNLREIGRALGVAYVVEGSVQRAGNRIQVNAQLIDARSDAHRWAEIYNRDLADVFAIQSEISQAIAGQLQAVISPQEHAAMMEAPTHDEQAYQFYLRAVASWNDLDQAVDYQTMCNRTLDLLRQATARDPGFVRAFTLMTEVQSLLYYNVEQTPALDAAARALAGTVAGLRPGSADASLAMGYYDYYVRADYTRAHQEFSDVAQRSPNDARAYACLGAIERRQGRWDEALGSLSRALELDPESSAGFSIKVSLLSALRRYPEAEAMLDRRIAVRPHDFWLHLEKANLYLEWRADTRAARLELAALPPGYDPSGGTTIARVECDQVERNFPAARQDLAACPLTELNGAPRSLFEALEAGYGGEPAAAAKAYSVARPLVEAEVHAHPGIAAYSMMLAWVDAGLGHKDAALAEGRGALALVIQGDTQQGPNMAAQMAHVLTGVGENEEAIRVLQSICGKPYGPDYGSLKADPAWDPLRGDPRFAALVNALAPR